MRLQTLFTFILAFILGYSSIAQEEGTRAGTSEKKRNYWQNNDYSI
ncbi:MAG: hypothetical protein IPH89_01600 [Bacteroidetes bacterium]|nr:hypothetical protein [Bacteroidota bacterium]